MASVQKMIDYVVSVAKDDSHGYSQARRWPSEGTDFDCSSLMYESAEKGGFKVKRGWPRYTGSMVSDFTAAGFTAIPFDGNLNDLEPGDILLNTEHHTEMYIGNGKFVGAHSSETGGIDGKPGDQTGDEISICPAYIYWDGWDYVLVPPKGGSVAFVDGKYSVTVNGVGVRAKRGANSTLCCTLAKGCTLSLKAFKANSAGNTWAEIASGDHKGRFVCVRNKNGNRVKKI